MIAANDNQIPDTDPPENHPNRCSFSLHLGDCLSTMNSIQSNSVHMIACDLPYGVTACAWDSVIDFTSLWTAFRRILTPTGVVVAMGCQPFTTALGASNLPWLKYAFIWEKTRKTGFPLANRRPLRQHEDILIFSAGTTVHPGQSDRPMTYNPQGLVELALPRTFKDQRLGSGIYHLTRLVDGRRVAGRGGRTQTHTNYPTSILRFPSVRNPQHPTEKPVALFDFLIRTYTNPGELVLDPTMGSGTTGVAAIAAGRRFVGIERNAKFFDLATRRIGDALDQQRLAA